MVLVDEARVTWPFINLPKDYINIRSDPLRLDDVQIGNTKEKGHFALTSGVEKKKDHYIIEVGGLIETCLHLDRAL